MSGQPTGAVTQGHASQSSTGGIGQRHADGQGAIRHPARALPKVVPGKIGIGHHGVSQGHGELGQDQHEKGHHPIGMPRPAKGQPVGQVDAQGKVVQTFMGSKVLGSMVQG